MSTRSSRATKRADEPARRASSRTRLSSKTAVARAPKVAKLSVSLPAADAAWLRAIADRDGRPFSLVLGDVLRQARRDQAWRTVRDELLGGRALTSEELESAERELRAAFGEE